jgi:hypothetical protein
MICLTFIYYCVFISLSLIIQINLIVVNVLRRTNSRKSLNKQIMRSLHKQNTIHVRALWALRRVYL